MKKAKFIRSSGIYINSDKTVYSIFATRSWEGFDSSWEKHQWLKGYFGKEASRVGKQFWDTLVEAYEVRVLIEENGHYREEISRESG